MAAYKIFFRESAKRELKELPKKDLLRTLDRIKSLGENPRGSDSAKLKGDDGYRVRQGNYRVIYQINESKKIIEIVKVGHRREVYR